MVCKSKWIFAASVFAGFALTALPAVGQKDVVVVNGPAQPVPTAAQGTTTVAGKVNVTNPLDGQSNPIPLATSEAFHPFEDTCTISFNGNGAGFCLFQTPAPGTRIVVQQFDAASGFLPFGLESGCKPLVVALKVTHAGTSHFFPATFMGTQTSTNRDFYATHQDTHLYGDPGEVPQCTVDLSCFSQAGYSCQLSGFLVP